MNKDKNFKQYNITCANHKSAKIWDNVQTATWDEYIEKFSSHEEGEKDGFCYTPATFRNKKRTKKEAQQIDLGVLDCDTGETIEKIQQAIEKAGYCAIIHSTYSHMINETKVSRSEWDKKKYIDAEDYLINNKGMQKNIAENAVIADHGDPDTYTIVHKPCPKFRIIFPLEKPWKASDYISQEEANIDWERKIKALALKLGIQHDQSCTDTSRLYYFPRHAEGAEHVTKVIEGSPCNLDELSTYALPPMNKPKKAQSHKTKTEYIFECPDTGKKINLKQWASEYGSRFNIIEILKKHKPEIFVDYVADGRKHHIRCINEEAHTKQGPDNATFIVAPDKSESGSFVYHCRHAHCCDLDRLHFINKMLEDGILTVDNLYPEDTKPPLSFHEIEFQAQQIDQNTSPDDIHDIIHEVNKAELSPLHRESIFKSIAKNTHYTLKSLRETSVKASKQAAGDTALKVAKETLKRFYKEGKHLVRAGDRQFWEFNGKYWQPIRDELLEQKILMVVQDMVDPSEKEYRKTMCDALDLISSTQAIGDEFFENIGNLPSVINFQNGELWLYDDGNVELKKHDPSSYLTYCLDINYDPEATCERFEQAIRETFSNASDVEDMVRHVLEIMAYIIQPSRFITCFFMWIGNGSNGKTTLYETLERLICSNAISAERIGEIEKNRFALGELMGKVLLIDDDVDIGTKLPDGLIKKLSERKRITGEKKFKDKFSFVSSAAILLLANNPPLSNDISHGMRRRAQVVPFDRQFTKQDANKKLFPYIWRHERSGIMNLLITALHRLRKRGDFQEPNDCTQAKKEWLAAANPLPCFLNEHTKDDPNKNITLQELSKAFRIWLRHNNIKESYSNQRLRSELEALGYSLSRVDGRWRINGLLFLPY